MAGWVEGALIWALPWWTATAITAWRWRDAPSLDDASADPPDGPPLLSIIVPARNEARNIAACLKSLLASEWPRLEILVVDDHSSDGTRELAFVASGGDRRVTVLAADALPPGWLGKQWACAYGAARATGELLLFTDADVRHGPQLHVRLVNAMLSSNADFVSVAGHQEMCSFWERVVQPYVFAILALRYGGPGAVNRSSRPVDKIANGQCLVFRREAYRAFGGHWAVRDHAAEDLAFAQRMFARGFRTRLVLATRHMTTRMYSSLHEIVAGWGKNVFAAGRDALPGGTVGRVLAPLLIPLPAVITLTPVVALASVISGDARPTILGFACAATAIQLVWAIVTARHFRLSGVWGLGYPLGALLYLYLAVRAVRRGRRIQWKDREYTTPAA